MNLLFLFVNDTRLFSTFISHIWDYILGRNNRQCVNVGDPWSSVCVHMILLREIHTTFCLKTMQFTRISPMRTRVIVKACCTHYVLEKGYAQRR